MQSDGVAMYVHRGNDLAIRWPQLQQHGLTRFNHHLYIDLKFVHDMRAKRYAVLLMLDLGTNKHDCMMVKIRRSDYVAGKFMRH